MSILVGIIISLTGALTWICLRGMERILVYGYRSDTCGVSNSYSSFYKSYRKNGRFYQFNKSLLIIWGLIGIPIGFLVLMDGWMGIPYSVLGFVMGWIATKDYFGMFDERIEKSRMEHLRRIASIISIRTSPPQSMTVDGDSEELRRTIEEMQTRSLFRHGILQCEIERIMDLIVEQEQKAKALEDQFVEARFGNESEVEDNLE